MTYINKNTIFGSSTLVLALAFVMGFAGIPAAHAQYYEYGTPTYNYGNVYTPTYQQQQAPVYASCYPQPLTIQTGQTASWLTSLSGGNGVYYVSWTGTDGLSGTGSSISKTYYSSGYKTASVTVTSGGQTTSVNCSGNVNVQGTTYYYNNPPTTYYNPTTYYSPLQISCNANTAIASIGSAVNWLANVTGGNGVYNYTWSGTDGITGYGQSISTSYLSPGLKTAQVTVYSNGQTLTQSCSSAVSVNTYQNNYVISNPVSSNSSGLDVGCFADPASATVNQAVTWNVEVTGGVAPYTYSWTGSDGLSGSNASVIKYYSSIGQKDAIVIVTSADGKTATRACTNALTIHGASTYVAPVKAQPVSKPAVQDNSQSNNQSAAALFSLQNIPWGWVAVLIILVLFGTVLYLMFNRPKI